MISIQTTYSSASVNTAQDQVDAATTNGFSALQWALMSLSVALQDKAVVEVDSEKKLIADQVEKNNENAENNFVSFSWAQTHKYITLQELIMDISSIPGNQDIKSWDDLKGGVAKDGDVIPSGAEFQQFINAMQADLKNKDWNTANILVRITPDTEAVQENNIANEQVEKIRAYKDGQSKIDQQFMQTAMANNSSTVASVTQVADLLSANNDALTESSQAIGRA